MPPPCSGRTVPGALWPLARGAGRTLLPVSQVGPLSPAGHWQLKLLTPCVQVPPF